MSRDCALNQKFLLKNLFTRFNFYNLCNRRNSNGGNKTEDYEVLQPNQ